MVFDPALLAEAQALIGLYTEKSLTLATAESCTGGLVAGLLTEIAGASAVVERGFVVYSNEAKQDMLGVSPALIAAHGAVSRETALALVAGVFVHARADIAVSITGIAGPGGGSDAKPVGLVHFACGVRGRPAIALERRFGDIGRSAVRRAALLQALDLLRAAANN